MPHTISIFYIRFLFSSTVALQWLVTVAIVLTITGCSIFSGEDDDPTADWSVNELYDRAKAELKSGDYELAIEYFETLEARFPFGEYAEQAQMQTSYAYYKFEEFDSSIAAADRFIKLHPTHPNVDYAYYLRGLASFHKNDTPMNNIVHQDPSMRDPSSTRDSFNYFAELVKRFPTSKYVADSIQRMKYQRNVLANHEIHVANYYMKRGAYVAVINRAKYVVEHYPQTPAIPEALDLLKTAYAKLEMEELAADAKRVLEASYPEYLQDKSKKVNNAD